MNASRWPFPALDADRAATAATLAGCARAGVVPTRQSLPPRGAMLRFEVTGPSAALRLALAAEHWCPATLPELAGLAWAELVDAQAVACWLPDRPLLDIPGMAGAQVDLLEVVPVSAIALGEGPQPCLQTAQGPAWIERIDAAPSRALAPATDALCLPVELGIARLQLPLHRLRTLAPGAVVLIDQLAPVARTARRRLYAFDFTLETISVNTPFDFLDDEDTGADHAVAVPADPAAPDIADASTGIDIRRLPVSVDVVLCQLQQSIGELDALQPGTVFHLPHDAWKQLQLRVNGQTIARGELVQVGDQLGVQLAQAPVLP